MYIPSQPVFMGIVNVTPDSFSDGGEFFEREDAVAQALRLAGEGAGIIDIGGESTRPSGVDYGEGASTVSIDEEIRRVIPVIEAVHAERPNVTISIDTMKPEVALAAIRAGAGMINDVSAGRFDESIWKIAAANNVPYILMHGHDPHHPVTAESAFYEDVVEEVFAFLDDRIKQARRAGIEHVIADVGIGFSKGATDNIRLIREHSRFSELGIPLLVGVSRKSFIGRMLGGAPLHERLYGTLGAVAVAANNGASILRVHDVKATRDFFTVYNALHVPDHAANAVYAD